MHTIATKSKIQMQIPNNTNEQKKSQQNGQPMVNITFANFTMYCPLSTVLHAQARTSMRTHFWRAQIVIQSKKTLSSTSTTRINAKMKCTN